LQQAACWLLLHSTGLPSDAANYIKSLDREITDEVNTVLKAVE